MEVKKNYIPTYIFNLYFLFIVAVPTDSDLPDVTFEGTADMPSMYLVNAFQKLSPLNISATSPNKKLKFIHSLSSLPY